MLLLLVEFGWIKSRDEHEYCCCYRNEQVERTNTVVYGLYIEVTSIVNM
jgi:hypothetical protein